ncbi:MAG: hypothetical protein AAFR67_02350, partial [Chloroflexota bacterium]
LTNDPNHGGYNWCDYGRFNQQDFTNSNFDYFDTSTGVWTPGIYYVDCGISFDYSNMVAHQVSFIATGTIDGNNSPYDFIAYGDVPLFVSNAGTGTGCSSATYAIKLNAGGSYFEGPFIAFRGSVSFDGNNFIVNSCISARGIYQNGNEGAVYACIPGTTQTSTPMEFGIIE